MDNEKSVYAIEFEERNPIYRTEEDAMCRIQQLKEELLAILDDADG